MRKKAANSVLRALNRRLTARQIELTKRLISMQLIFRRSIDSGGRFFTNIYCAATILVVWLSRMALRVCSKRRVQMNWQEVAAENGK